MATVKGVKSLDGIRAGGNKISISGDADDDSIKIMGKSTTVTGGKGNDTLWGSSYADSFIYSAGDGKDIIYGFDDKDTLTLDDLDFISSYKNNSLALTVNGGSVTFKDFTATTFNINGDDYKISGAKLVKK